MRSVNWKELVRVCKEEGCVFDRQRGDHYIMTRPGMARPIMIPRKRELKERIVLNIATTLAETRNEIFNRFGRREPSRGNLRRQSGTMISSVHSGNRTRLVILAQRIHRISMPVYGVTEYPYDTSCFEI